MSLAGYTCQHEAPEKEVKLIDQGILELPRYIPLCGRRHSILV